MYLYVQNHTRTGWYINIYQLDLEKKTAGNRLVGYFQLTILNLASREQHVGQHQPLSLGIQRMRISTSAQHSRYNPNIVLFLPTNHLPKSLFGGLGCFDVGFQIPCRSIVPAGLQRLPAHGSPIINLIFLNDILISS